MHLARAEHELHRRVEEWRAGDERVVFAELAARIDAERFEFAHGIDRDRSSKPALIEVCRARGDDDRRAPARDEFIDERSRRFTPDRQHGCEAMRGAHALVPCAMGVAHDVAEDHVRDPERRRRAEHTRVFVGVGAPRAASGQARDAETLRMGGDDVGPQPMRPAPLAVLGEHRHHGGNVVIVVRAEQRRAAVLAATPRDGRARLYHASLAPARAVRRHAG